MAAMGMAAVLVLGLPAGILNLIPFLGGIALALPLVAIIRLLVVRLYVDDGLGGRHRAPSQSTAAD